MLQVVNVRPESEKIVKGMSTLTESITFVQLVDVLCGKPSRSKTKNFETLSNQKLFANWCTVAVERITAKLIMLDILKQKSVKNVIVPVMFIELGINSIENVNGPIEIKILSKNAPFKP